ncbi:fimbria/pilus outer membrane usher protein [Vibrio sinaloensis]|nr:fimbria/pilus outer membrane usher protein [Vibrio sinaloensis]
MLKVIYSLLLVFSYSLLANTNDKLSEEFDTRFLTNNPEYADFFNNQSDVFLGSYTVELYVNQKYRQGLNLVIEPFEYELNELCLSQTLFPDVDFIYYEEFKDINNGCYFIGREQYTTVDFSIDTLTLDILIPQFYLKSDLSESSSEWEDGELAIRADYLANISKGNDNRDPYYFANLNMKINSLGWYGQIDGYASQDRIDVSSFKASTGLEQFGTELTVGQTWTGSDIYQNFGFIGGQLSTDFSMKPNSYKEYSPIVSGVSEENSTLTVSQSGVVIYQTRLTPGPYRLEDLRPVSNGDLIIEIKGDSGKLTVETIPTSVLPQMLRAGVFEYGLSAGFINSSVEEIREDIDQDNFFVSYNFSTGLESSTLLGSSLLSDGYLFFGAKYMMPLNYFGTLGLTVSRSQAKSIQDDWTTGYSFRAEYARNINAKTDFNLLSYRYQNEEYVEFSDYKSKTGKLFKSKERYEARLSSRFENGSISSSMWKESSWQGKESVGINLTGSINILGNTLSLSSNYRDNGLSDISLSLSVPLDYNYSNVARFSTSYSAESDELFSSASSQLKIDEKLSVHAGIDRSVNGASVSVNGNVATKTANYSLGINGDDKGNVFLASSVSGSTLYTNDSGLILSTLKSNTVGIVGVDGLQGVKVNGSETNSDGFAVVPLSPYRENLVNINSFGVSSDIELASSSLVYKPSKNSVLYRKVSYSRMNKYNLLISNAERFENARNLDVVNDKNESVGYLYQGMIIASMESSSDYLVISANGEDQCRVYLNDVIANADTIYRKECQ